MSTTVTYRVPDVSCDHCRAAITNEVGAVSGVEAVDVDLNEKLVTITGELLDERALIAAIGDAGYEVAG